MTTGADDSESDSIAERSIEDLARAIDQASDGSYGFLVGAGVSRPGPAEIPTGGELIDKFQTELHGDLSDGDVNVEDWAAEYEAEHDVDEGESYGFWFSKARPTPGNRREEIEELVDGADPPFGQIILASMMDKGIISHTITPNFDNLLFKASHQYADNRPFLIDHHAKAPQFSLSDDRPAIVKVHGDYLHYTQNTSSETAELDDSVKELFQRTIKDYGLVVVGYSGTDDSLMSVLEHEPISEHGLFWCTRDRSELERRAKEFLESSKNAYLVEIEGSESLFGRLWGDIDRVRLPLPDDILNRARSRSNRVEQQMDEYLGKKSEPSSETADWNEDTVKSIVWRARKLASEDKYEEAISALDKATSEGFESTEIYRTQGSVYLESDRYEDAIDCFDNAIDLDPQNDDAYMGRGVAHNNLREYENSIEDHSEAIKINPGKALAYANRGGNYLMIGDIERAIDDFKQAIQLDYENITLYLNLSEAYIITEKPNKAKRASLKALELSKDTEYTAKSMMLLTIAKMTLGEDTSQEQSRYQEICSKTFTTIWLFDPIESWLSEADLSEEIKEEIREILDQLREHVNTPGSSEESQIE
ncbi:tetratricopeptide repeat protein [Halobaculum lipolyticum]|uniref:Tetratricopeptide repeat protein n=1 Tax=Halobaculum lipolyticum TaxID=3032001 RepID=A0ABD5WDL6_9EURY